MSPGKKAKHTAKWARTMTKWLVTYTRRDGARWNLVDFNGKAGAESRGIVDLLAIRKNHRDVKGGVKRGDSFEIVLIQVKGGAAARPTLSDTARVAKVARYHRAKAVVLAEWKRAEKLGLFKLSRSRWKEVPPEEIFG